MYKEFGNNVLYFEEQYSQFREHCNWYNFDLIRVNFDHDAYIGDFSLELALLGFKVRYERYWTNETTTRLKEELADAIKDLDKESQNIIIQGVSKNKKGDLTIACKPKKKKK
jgi:hypothetical protein